MNLIATLTVAICLQCFMVVSSLLTEWSSDGPPTMDKLNNPILPKPLNPRQPTVHDQVVHILLAFLRHPVYFSLVPLHYVDAVIDGVQELLLDEQESTSPMGRRTGHALVPVATVVHVMEIYSQTASGDGRSADNGKIPPSEYLSSNSSMLASVIRDMYERIKWVEHTIKLVSEHMKDARISAGTHDILQVVLKALNQQMHNLPVLSTPNQGYNTFLSSLSSKQGRCFPTNVYSREMIENHLKNDTSQFFDVVSRKKVETSKEKYQQTNDSTEKKINNNLKTLVETVEGGHWYTSPISFPDVADPSDNEVEKDDANLDANKKNQRSVKSNKETPPVSVKRNTTDGFVLTHSVEGRVLNASYDFQTKLENASKALRANSNTKHLKPAEFDSIPDQHFQTPNSASHFSDLYKTISTENPISLVHAAPALFKNLFHISPQSINSQISDQLEGAHYLSSSIPEFIGRFQRERFSLQKTDHVANPFFIHNYWSPAVAEKINQPHRHRGNEININTTKVHSSNDTLPYYPQSQNSDSFKNVAIYQTISAPTNILSAYFGTALQKAETANEKFHSSEKMKDSSVQGTKTFSRQPMDRLLTGRKFHPSSRVQPIENAGVPVPRTNRTILSSTHRSYLYESMQRMISVLRESLNMETPSQGEIATGANVAENGTTRNNLSTIIPHKYLEHGPYLIEQDNFPVVSKKTGRSIMKRVDQNISNSKSYHGVQNERTKTARGSALNPRFYIGRKLSNNKTIDQPIEKNNTYDLYSIGNGTATVNETKSTNQSGELILISGKSNDRVRKPSISVPEEIDDIRTLTEDTDSTSIDTLRTEDGNSSGPENISVNDNTGSESFKNETASFSNSNGPFAIKHTVSYSSYLQPFSSSSRSDQFRSGSFHSPAALPVFVPYLVPVPLRAIENSYPASSSSPQKNETKSLYSKVMTTTATVDSPRHFVLSNKANHGQDNLSQSSISHEMPIHTSHQNSSLTSELNLVPSVPSWKEKCEAKYLQALVALTNLVSILKQT